MLIVSAAIAYCRSMWPRGANRHVKDHIAGRVVARFHFALKPISSLLKVSMSGKLRLLGTSLHVAQAVYTSR